MRWLIRSGFLMRIGTLADERRNLVSANLSATLLIQDCKWVVLGGAWALTARDQDNEITFESVLGGSKASSGDPSAEVPGPTVEIDYRMAPYFHVWRRQVAHPLVSQLDGTGAITLSIDCIPFVQESHSADPLILDTEIRFFLVDRPTRSCQGQDCPRLYSSHTSRRALASDRCDFIDQ